MPLPLLPPKRPMGALGFAVAGEEAKGAVGGQMWMGEVDEACRAARVLKKGRFHWLTRGPAVGGCHK